MKKSLLLTSITLILFNISTAQTVDVSYLNPTITSGNNYEYLRFGNPSEYKAGLLWNNTSQSYGDGNDFSIFTYNNRDLTLFTGTGNFIVFPTSGGNVGIGTQSPAAKLHVNGNIRATSSITADKNGSYRVALNAGADGYINGRNDLVQNTFRIHSNGVSFFNGGDVGIGTNSPAAKLHIVGNGVRADRFSLSGIADLTNDSPWYGLGRGTFTDLSSDDTKASVQLAGYYGLLLKTATGSLGIHQNGNVGIGTTTPGSKLEIGVPHAINQNDEMRIGSYYQNKFIGIGFDYRIDAVGTTSKNIVEHHGNTSYTSMTFKLGNIGIGTTNPDAKLTVNGNIHTKEVKVDLNIPAPDYVFKDSYDLLTIEQVQQHIKENGHLPNIPSATEMETNGVELGSMNMKLLEKIEELTLYTIAQEKQLQQQKDTNKNLETRLAKLEALLIKK